MEEEEEEEEMMVIKLLKFPVKALLSPKLAIMVIP